MNWRATWAVVCGGVLALTLPFSFQARAQSQASDTVYHLHGTVLNGLSGQPLARALVVSNDRRLATMTDGTGQFSLEVRVLAAPVGVPSSDAAAAVAGGPLPAFNTGGATLFLMAQKPGFLLRPTQGQMVVLDPAVREREVHFRLLPTATVQGEVTVEEGDTPHNIRLMLLRHRVQDGRYRWAVESVGTTNAEGHFSFPELRPGEYTLVSAEWRGSGPLPEDRQNAQEYPPVFYGDTATLTAAGVLEVHAGESPHVELHLHRVPYYWVAIPLAGSGGGGGVQVQVDAGDTAGTFDLGYNAKTGAVEGRLPNGAYTVVVTGFAPPGSSGDAERTGHLQRSFGMTSFQVADTAVKTAAVALGPMPNVQVRIHGAGAAGTGGGFANLMLRSTGMLGGDYGDSTTTENADSMTVQGVPPGRYQVQAHADGYISELSCDGVDLENHVLVIGDGGLDRPVEMTVRKDGGTLSGQVTVLGDQVAAFRKVLLLPMDGTGRLEEGATGLDGRFTFAGVAPGSYRLFATENEETEIPYRDPAAMQAYADLGVPVNVVAGQEMQQDAPFVAVEAIEARREAADKRELAP